MNAGRADRGDILITSCRSLYRSQMNLFTTSIQSPFLNEEWTSGVVHITKGERQLKLDVRKSD